MSGSEADDFLPLLHSSSNNWPSTKFAFYLLVLSLKYTTAHKKTYWKDMFMEEVTKPPHQPQRSVALDLSVCVWLGWGPVAEQVLLIRSLECWVQMVPLCKYPGSSHTLITRPPWSPERNSYEVSTEHVGVTWLRVHGPYNAYDSRGWKICC